MNGKKIIQSYTFPFLNLSLLHSHTFVYKKISYKTSQTHNADAKLDGNMTAYRYFPLNAPRDS